MTEALKFRVGQQWRTRGGRTTTIVRIDDHNTHHPIKAVWDGSVQGRDYQEYTSSYTTLGTWRGDKMESDSDLVEMIQDAWVDWKGGENPVPGAFVSYQLRNGDSHEWGADLLGWGHGGSGSDIIRYRVVRPAPAPTAKPEPEPKPFSIDAPGDYVTRDGHKARVLCADRKGGDYPVVGLLYDVDGDEDLRTWTLHGRVRSSGEYVSDLIGKWDPFANLPIDAPVWVRDFPGDLWTPGHFAGVVEGKPHVWLSGCTSHTTESNTSMMPFAHIVTTKPENACK